MHSLSGCRLKHYGAKLSTTRRRQTDLLDYQEIVLLVCKYQLSYLENKLCMTLELEFLDKVITELSRTVKFSENRHFDCKRNLIASKNFTRRLTFCARNLCVSFCLSGKPRRIRFVRLSADSTEEKKNQQTINNINVF